ncbi:dATP/dGTP pyrophosphohydrolase domain-containing protein, partial [Achromobacter xylosoxidans]
SAPVAGEAVYTLRVRGVIRAWTPTAAAFSIPDGEHQLFLSPAAPQASAEAFDFVAHLARQAEFSARTFGPGARVAGVCDHIRKELIEVETSGGDLKEWVDVIILGLDGAWRSGATPQEIIAAIVAKQAKNEARTWPDWRTVDPNKAIEHQRTADPRTCPSGDGSLRHPCPMHPGADKGGPWCCERGEAQGVKVCQECAEISAGYQASMRGDKDGAEQALKDLVTHGVSVQRIAPADIMAGGQQRAGDGKTREALNWYAEQVAGCRKFGPDGEAARHALDRDGGQLARAALSAPQAEQGERDA